ncbi:hypothetical protein P153DRAFT_358141 [Dothidotthia symphoricarpi CBS 119687]|uniref:Uncharacterized protein n=1 Tax=Dothidotthia symphoricarpi CBS 119687 TaxID=1392245 RepID=A0A6A6A9Y4_9PLEO|nr:uncharacterized protein P153DRAFT_358141 [Dothidotthia symphoricarpi CBS 119687]KAF2127995.1 hypothetical protein P153DRAFT_358141 [Dothidotthia symphoricarpi CBS 119687]
MVGMSEQGQLPASIGSRTVLLVSLHGCSCCFWRAAQDVCCLPGLRRVALGRTMHCPTLGLPRDMQANARCLPPGTLLDHRVGDMHRIIPPSDTRPYSHLALPSTVDVAGSHQIDPLELPLLPLTKDNAARQSMVNFNGPIVASARDPRRPWLASLPVSALTTMSASPRMLGLPDAGPTSVSPSNLIALRPQAAFIASLSASDSLSVVATHPPCKQPPSCLHQNGRRQFQRATCAAAAQISRVDGCQKALGGHRTLPSDPRTCTILRCQMMNMRMHQRSARRSLIAWPHAAFIDMQSTAHIPSIDVPGNVVLACTSNSHDINFARC